MCIFKTFSFKLFKLCASSELFKKILNYVHLQNVSKNSFFYVSYFAMQDTQYFYYVAHMLLFKANTLKIQDKRMTNVVSLRIRLTIILAKQLILSSDIEFMRFQNWILISLTTLFR